MLKERRNGNMPELSIKEVRYDEWCPKCKYEETSEAESPCNECLGRGYNEYSHKPTQYKEKEN